MYLICVNANTLVHKGFSDNYLVRITCIKVGEGALIGTEAEKYIWILNYFFGGI